MWFYWASRLKQFPMKKGTFFRIAYQTLKGIISGTIKKPANKQLAGSLFHTINQSN